MYQQPNLSDPVDKLAYVISEIHNDNAPLGWEKYRYLAKSLIDKFGMEEAVKAYELK